MATAAPDPRSFESWEDGFQYPIPTTRALEKKLRIQIGENNEKLRSLVGSSYRELLGTAQTIVDINEQMQKVDNLISKTSRRSDSRILDRVARNEARLQISRKRQDGDRIAAASRLSLLQRALDCIAGILRQRGSLLLAAKLLVVSRHLLAETSTSGNTHPFKDQMELKLASLKHRLLRHIDRRLSDSDASISLIVNDLTAFSLATSSTPSNVMAHFQRVRLDSIKRSRSRMKIGGVGPADRLHVYAETCQMSRAVFPDLLRSSLKSLSAAPLLRDPAIQALDQLKLGFHEQWVSEKVRNFTPYPRLDELERQRATEMMHDWTNLAAEALAESIRGDLSDVSDLDVLLKLRKETLQAWLSSRQHVRGFSHQQIMHKLRSPFQDRAMAVISQNLNELENSIRLPFQSTLSDSGLLSSQRPARLWEQDLLDMDISDGAEGFRQAVTARRLGRHEGAESQLTLSFGSSAKALEAVAGHIKRMSDSRWDDDYDLEGEDNDDEPAETADTNQSVSRMLSEEDPAALRQAFRSSIHASISRSESWIMETIDTERQDCASADAPGVSVLRSVRDLRRRIPQLRQALDPGCPQPLFCARLVQEIHVRLVESVSAEVGVPSFASWANGFASSSPTSKLPSTRALWDGTPPLPVLPSPAVFRHLRTITKRMETLGADLWSPEAVQLLKDRLAGDLASWLRDCRKKALEEEEKAEEVAATSSESEPAATAHAKADDKQTNQMALSAYADKQKEDGEQQQDTNGQRVTGDSSNGDGNDDDNDAAAKRKAADETKKKEDEEEEVEEKEEEEDEEEEGNSRRRQDETNKEKKLLLGWKLTQLAFDARYLQHALSPLTSTSTSEPASLPAAAADAADGFERDADLGEPEKTRVGRAAAECWRRGYLLFGLLAY